MLRIPHPHGNMCSSCAASSTDYGFLASLILHFLQVSFPQTHEREPPAGAAQGRHGATAPPGAPASWPLPPPGRPRRPPGSRARGAAPPQCLAPPPPPRPTRAAPGKSRHCACHATARMGGMRRPGELAGLNVLNDSPLETGRPGWASHQGWALRFCQWCDHCLAEHVQAASDGSLSCGSQARHAHSVLHQRLKRPRMQRSPHL